jgi:hypothetical protein
MDARTVLAYAVASGFTTADGRKVDDATIARIEAAEDLLGQANLPDAKARADFESAYRDLTLLLAPITAETLCATSDDHPVRSWITLRIAALSESRCCSGNWCSGRSLRRDCLRGQPYVPARHPRAGVDQFAGNVLKRLLPSSSRSLWRHRRLRFSQGLHQLHRREFDPSATEYYSHPARRGRGGMVCAAGGNLNDGTNAVHISAAALGLLAGAPTSCSGDRTLRRRLQVGPKQRQPAAPAGRRRCGAHQGPTDAAVSGDRSRREKAIRRSSTRSRPVSAGGGDRA